MIHTITKRQRSILLEITRAREVDEPISVTSIAHLFGVSRFTASEHLSKLKALGFLRDGRGVTCITDEGREISAGRPSLPKGPQKPIAITPRQFDVVRCVVDFWRVNRLSPTLAEIATSLGISKVTVHNHLRALESRGAVSRSRSRRRSIVPTQRIMNQLRRA